MVRFRSHIIKCSWEQDESGWRLWVARHREICASGADYDSAQEGLIKAVWSAADELDDVEMPVFQFDPPLPLTAEAEPFGTPELYIISGDGSFHAPRRGDSDWQDPSTLYHGGLCPECHTPLGPRTDEPVVVADGERADAGFMYTTAGLLRLFSEQFLAHLSDREHASLTFRPVRNRSRRARPMFELIAEPTVPFVSLKGYDADGSACPQCGQGSYHLFDPILNAAPNYLLDFVCAADLPEPSCTMFAVGPRSWWSLCVPAHRRRELLNAKHSVGLTSVRIGVTPPDLADRYPRLCVSQRRVRCPICTQWPQPMHVRQTGQARFDLAARDWSARNWTWIEPAAAEGIIQITRQSAPISDVMARTKEDYVRKPEFVIFHCTQCWRLGYVNVHLREVEFIWS